MNLAQGNTALWYRNPEARAWTCPPPPDPGGFHQSMPGYHVTPLMEAGHIAEELGVGRLFIKDESERLELPAFKMLGASWAVYRVIAAFAPNSHIPPDLTSLRALASSMSNACLVTATDGNHGRAVARMARLLGLPARVFIPNSVDPRVASLIESEGATVTVLDLPYDAAVEHAAKISADESAILVQDTAWPGYEQRPQWIVDGYSTLFREIDSQLAEAGAGHADLVVVPTGVGSLAQAAVSYFRSTQPPAALLAVEPASAACVTTSLINGRRTSVSTGHTAMAGLNCGTPSSIAWPFLREGLDASICVTEEQASAAVENIREFGVLAGPCGAASLAAARSVLNSEEWRASLGITNTSTVVLLSTEGLAS